MVRHGLRFLAALALCAGVARAESSLRCGSRIVAVGDARIDLLARCGEPALRERRVQDYAQGVTNGTMGQGRRLTAVIEEWTYDFGPQSFAYLVRLVNGRIIAIDRLSYGYASGGPKPVRIPRAQCDPGTLHAGDAKLDVLARCGEPAMVDAWDEERGVVSTLEPGWSAGGSATIRVEVWTYDLGPNQFVRFIRMENGRVTEVLTGTYGYAD
jgi:hypothetical protein